MLGRWCSYYFYISAEKCNLQTKSSIDRICVSFDLKARNLCFLRSCWLNSDCPESITKVEVLHLPCISHIKYRRSYYDSAPWKTLERTELLPLFGMKYLWSFGMAYIELFNSFSCSAPVISNNIQIQFTDIKHNDYDILNWNIQSREDTLSYMGLCDFIII